VNDFICIQAAFAAGASYADCDQNSALNVNDFVCFQSAFAAGCPQAPSQRVGVALER
jgi:hypothetical protein